MLRPSYNEQIHGFGFNIKQIPTGDLTSTQLIFGPTVDVVSEVVTDQGSVFMHSGNTNKLSVLVNDQAGVGAFIGISADTRECYSYSMNGIIKCDAQPLFGFVGTLEVAHAADALKTANILAILPLKQTIAATRVAVNCEGFVRPNVNPSGYAQIGSVTGLVFGIAMANGGGTVEMRWAVSFEIQRWNDPDVNIRTPVV